MNFDKESKSEDFFFFFGGGGGGGEGVGGGEGFQPKKKENTKSNRYSLIFCVHALYKISSSWLKWFSSVNTNTNKRLVGWLVVLGLTAL